MKRKKQNKVFRNIAKVENEIKELNKKVEVEVRDNISLVVKIISLIAEIITIIAGTISIIKNIL